MALQDKRQFAELPLGGTKPLARIHRDMNEVPGQMISGSGIEAQGASLVNGTGCTYVRTCSTFFSPPTSKVQRGGGNFAY